MAEENIKMTMFCARCLSSVPFSRGLDESHIEKHVHSGYYGFLDYAAAYWWSHAKRIINNPEQMSRQNLPVLRSVSEFLKSSGYVHRLTREDRGDNESDGLRKAITDLPEDGMEEISKLHCCSKKSYAA